jgi:hypothetical protein
MPRLRQHPLFNQTPNPTGGDTPPAAKSALDLNTKIKLEDGKEVSILSILADQAKLAAQVRDLQVQAGQIPTLQKTLGTLFSGQAPDEEREKALREVLKFQGSSDEQIEAHLKLVKGEGEQPEGDDDVENPQIAQLQSQIEELKQREQARVASEKTSSKKAIAERLQNTIKEIVSSNPKIKRLVDEVGRRGGDNGDEAKSKFIASFTDLLDKETRAGLNVRFTQTNGQYDEKWLAEEAAKAADKLIIPHEALLGDINHLGRSPEVVRGMEVLKKERAPAPEYKPGKDSAVLDKEIDTWLEDELKRDLASIDAGGDTKV